MGLVSGQTMLVAWVLSGPVKCQLRPVLTIRFVRFRPLTTFNRLETMP
jgi:hypothetical protein